MTESLFHPSVEAVVIPVYQGEAELPQVLERLGTVVPFHRVLVVDDGSDDRSGDVALSFGAEVIRFPENRGKGKALEEGIRYWAQRGAERVVTLDGDGQHPPELVGSLLEASRRTGAGIVIAARDLKDKQMPCARRFSNSTTTRMLSRLAGVPLFDSQSGFRCYRTRLLEKGVFPSSSRFAWESEILVLAAWAGESVQSVAAPTIYIRNGGSHISHLRDTIRFLKVWRRLSRVRRQGR